MNKYIEIEDRNNNLIKVFSEYKNDKISYSTYHKEGAKLDKDILSFISALICQLYGKNSTQKINGFISPNYYRKYPCLKGKKMVLRFVEKDILTDTVINSGYQFTNNQ